MTQQRPSPSYQIWRDEKRIVHCTNPEGNKLKPIPVHSPTGFEFGYGGSGPAELSLCILTDCLGREEADRYYQTFKWDKIAKISAEVGERFIITAEEIDGWLEDVRRTYAD